MLFGFSSDRAVSAGVGASAPVPGEIRVLIALRGTARRADEAVGEGVATTAISEWTCNALPASWRRSAPRRGTGSGMELDQGHRENCSEVGARTIFASKS